MNKFEIEIRKIALELAIRNSRLDSNAKNIIEKAEKFNSLFH